LTLQFTQFQISTWITFLGHFGSWKEVQPKHVLPEMLACSLPCLVTKCWEWLASKQILQNASRHHVKIYFLDFYHTVVIGLSIWNFLQPPLSPLSIYLCLKDFYLFAKISENI
jgi:hypothetical protein